LASNKSFDNSIFASAPKECLDRNEVRVLALVETISSSVDTFSFQIKSVIILAIG
jgi:hypothetical protein